MTTWERLNALGCWAKEALLQTKWTTVMTWIQESNTPDKKDAQLCILLSTAMARADSLPTVEPWHEPVLHRFNKTHMRWVPIMPPPLQEASNENVVTTATIMVQFTQTPPLLYTQNRDPNFVFFSYSSCEKLCFNDPKRSTRQIYDSLKIDQVINFELRQYLPLPNKAYHEHLQLLYMVYLIKNMSNCFINSTVRGMFVTAKLLYLHLLCTHHIHITMHLDFFWPE